MGTKNICPSQLGFEPRIFEQVPAHNLHGSLKISTLTAEKNKFEMYTKRCSPNTKQVRKIATLNDIFFSCSKIMLNILSVMACAVARQLVDYSF